RSEGETLIARVNDPFAPRFRQLQFLLANVDAADAGAHAGRDLGRHLAEPSKADDRNDVAWLQPRSLDRADRAGARFCQGGLGEVDLVGHDEVAAEAVLRDRKRHVLSETGASLAARRSFGPTLAEVFVSRAARKACAAVRQAYVGNAIPYHKFAHVGANFDNDARVLVAR